MRKFAPVLDFDPGNVSRSSSAVLRSEERHGSGSRFSSRRMSRRHSIEILNPLNVYEITTEDIPLDRPYRSGQTSPRNLPTRETSMVYYDENQVFFPPSASLTPQRRSRPTSPTSVDLYPRLHASAAVSAVPSSASSSSSKSLPVAPHGWPLLSEFPAWYWKRLTGFDQELNRYCFTPSWDQLIGFFFTAITLLVFTFLQYHVFTLFAQGNVDLFVPAFAASSTCVFSVPKLPISQPRNIIFAHVTAGVIGVALVNAFIYMPQQPYGIHLAGAIGVGLHQLLMVFTNTLHPPASATVISAAITSFQPYFHDRGFFFCLSPCLLGSIIVVIMSILLNNLVPARSPYPQYW